MGQVVAAVATAHAPQLFTRPPSEDPKQLDATIGAIHELAKTLDETKPDLVVIFGSDHLETFFLSAVPTFAAILGEKAQAAFAGKNYAIPVHEPFGEEMLDTLVAGGFDMCYSQDAVLGHSFAAVFEWMLEGRNIPVVPIFVNTYLPPLPTPRRCEALGKAILKVVNRRPERVAVIASGGMSHYPGTWKYSQPAFDFDHWLIDHLERGNPDAFLDLTNEQLDEVGNTEILPWAPMFGMIGKQHAELIQYTPTWHHGHGMLRFLPARTEKKTGGEAPSPTYNFANRGGFEFYKHPTPASYRLNKVIYDLRHKQRLRLRLIENSDAVAEQYGLSPEETVALRTLLDENIDLLRNPKPHPLVEAGAHPLGMLMCIVVVQAEARRLRAQGKTPQQAEQEMLEEQHA